MPIDLGGDSFPWMTWRISYFELHAGAHRDGLCWPLFGRFAHWCGEFDISLRRKSPSDRPTLFLVGSVTHCLPSWCIVTGHSAGHEVPEWRGAVAHVMFWWFMEMLHMWNGAVSSLRPARHPTETVGFPTFLCKLFFFFFFLVFVHFNKKINKNWKTASAAGCVECGFSWGVDI